MLSRPDTHGASKLATMVETSSRRGCDVTVGNAACKAIAETSSALSLYSLHENASVVWEFLKGRTLPGIAALDRVCIIYILCFCGASQVVFQTTDIEVTNGRIEKANPSSTAENM